MRLIISSILILFTVSLFAATVYKTVDENGNVIFTDKPSDNSEEIQLKELQTIKNPNPAKYQAPQKKSMEPDLSHFYKSFVVANPADGSAFRNNAGNVSISILLQPGLRPGHSLVITLDGKEVSKGSGLSVSLNNVDRGTHNIGASIVDSNGKQIISTSSSFSLLRHSK